MVLKKLNFTLQKQKLKTKKLLFHLKKYIFLCKIKFYSAKLFFTLQNQKLRPKNYYIFCKSILKYFNLGELIKFEIGNNFSF
jgi:hypothetical protein